MLVFACAGMDRACKALVEDAFRALADLDLSVEESLAKYVTRRITPGGVVDSAALSRVLLSPWNPRHALLADFVNDLTGDSLQSVSQLFRVYAALRVQDGYVRERKEVLSRTFAARNEIVHEMDLVTTDGRPDRRLRNDDELVFMASGALAVADHLLHATSEVILARARSDPFWARQGEYQLPGAAP